VNLFGSKSIAIAIDEKDEKVAVHGWKNKSEFNYIDFAKYFETINVSALIFTPISVDGTLMGPQLEKTLRLVESVSLPIIASGGVASLNDLVALKKTGVKGVIVGAAIYEKKFTFKEAEEIVNNAC
jgi:phosphoribosylformimino-5-aminoimidazole carboxamide ribotide isomerase